MSGTEAALSVLTNEWPMDLEVTGALRNWLEGKAAQGEDPMTYAEGMAVKVRGLKDSSNPAGFILWSIREGKDADYLSLAPKRGYISSKVREIVAAVASKSAYSHAQLMEMHARGGIPWKVVAIYSESYVDRAIRRLREHVQGLGFQDIRVNSKTPALYDGEWAWEPVPQGFEPATHENPTVARLNAERREAANAAMDT